MRMASQPASRETPAKARRRERMLATRALKSVCHEPASRSIACLTVRLVVNGPGVKSNLSRAAGISGVICMKSVQKVYFTETND